MFPKNLKNLRAEKGLTQKKLAEILKLDESTICKYEKGSCLPSQKVLLKIGDYFNVSLDELLGRKETVNYPPPIEAGACRSLVD
ncbi:Helix-turn-helix domain-containing protein [Desulforamulus putei DSM 12395]|uniref:Helix-turn-helix domain-containing protein n=1 Tax=Desulforamulus putei DSM 12395 TaxID=1121429 RepID=A0A1M4ZBT2_9FIRM|nr:helix-turn-helix transcriptional regulator [Desulforamulus putei]SHF15242.1 Helix-turn-helix domain-containing protein [Desulforamulus putei DSM 12395]